MNISSTPFIRNDYWPDYNHIDILNKRIDEAENETSLVNSRLTNDIENVSNNLNSYKNEVADTVITNNIIVNNLNANYAAGKYANFINTNTDNAYIENLTVNKPVFDITLNTPHVENITSIGGNFYDANLFNVAVENMSGVLGNVEINNAVINTANVAELFVNTQPEPVTSSAVLGYDSEGRVIPIKAAFEVGFPENANYLFTDQHGTAFPGIAETEVNASDNLITSYAVYNALANVNNSFNNVNNSFNNVNNFVNNGFNDVNNSFNNVNNFVNNGFNNINNFVNNGFNNVNIFVNNGFNNVANELNDAYNTINKLQDKIRILSVDDANEYWSGAPVNYQNVTLIKFNFGKSAGTQISGKFRPVNIAFNSTSNILEFSSLGFNASGGIHPAPLSQIFNRDISYLFSGCRQLNYSANIQNNEFNFNFCEPTGNFITNMSCTFMDCKKFNQPVQIPDSVTNIDSIFCGCSVFNQNIKIPNSVTKLCGPFCGCLVFNQNILIPNSVTNMMDAFGAVTLSPAPDFDEVSCPNLNQCILIPNSVTDITRCFSDCNNLRQSDMYIYSQNITNMTNAFKGCHINNIHVPTSVPKDTSNFMYNCLVNGNTGITFPASNIFNDLPVDPEQWPPV